MITYSESTRAFLTGMIEAYKGVPSHECILDGIAYGLALSAHRPKFAGRLLEEISMSKTNWQSMKDDLLVVADICDQA